MEQCENCQEVIGALQTPWIWNNHTVCARCREALAREDEPDVAGRATAQGTAAPLRTSAPTWDPSVRTAPIALRSAAKRLLVAILRPTAAYVLGTLLVIGGLIFAVAACRMYAPPGPSDTVYVQEGCNIYHLGYCSALKGVARAAMYQYRQSARFVCPQCAASASRTRTFVTMIAVAFLLGGVTLVGSAILRRIRPTWPVWQRFPCYTDQAATPQRTPQPAPQKISYCARCGTATTPGSRFCAKCSDEQILGPGRSSAATAGLQETGFCTQCAARLGAGAKVCVVCGAVVAMDGRDGAGQVGAAHSHTEAYRGATYGFSRLWNCALLDGPPFSPEQDRKLKTAIMSITWGWALGIVATVAMFVSGTWGLVSPDHRFELFNPYYVPTGFLFAGLVLAVFRRSRVAAASLLLGNVALLLSSSTPGSASAGPIIIWGFVTVAAFRYHSIVGLRHPRLRWYVPVTVAAAVAVLFVTTSALIAIIMPSNVDNRDNAAQAGSSPSSGVLAPQEWLDYTAKNAASSKVLAPQEWLDYTKKNMPSNKVLVPPEWRVSPEMVELAKKLSAKAPWTIPQADIDRAKASAVVPTATPAPAKAPSFDAATSRSAYTPTPVRSPAPARTAATDSDMESRIKKAQEIKALGVDVDYSKYTWSQLSDIEDRIEKARAIKALGVNVDYKQFTWSQLFDMENRIKKAQEIKALGVNVDYSKYTWSQLSDMESRIEKAREIKALGVDVDYSRYSWNELADMESRIEKAHEIKALGVNVDYKQYTWSQLSDMESRIKKAQEIKTQRR